MMVKSRARALITGVLKGAPARLLALGTFRNDTRIFTDRSRSAGRSVNFQVTVLKVLASYPDGLAAMPDLKRDIAFLAISGRDWADRTRRLAARVPALEIFSQGLVEREAGGWRITEKGRAMLDLMEVRARAPEPRAIVAAEQGAPGMAPDASAPAPQTVSLFPVVSGAWRRRMRVRRPPGGADTDDRSAC